MLENLRFTVRTTGFAGLTFCMYGLLELDTMLSPASAREAVLHTWIHRYGRALLALYGVDVRARGAYVREGRQYPERDEQGRGRLFVMNHRSGLDIAVSLAFFEATILSRADLAKWPVIGLAARRVDTLFVNREDRRSGAAAIHAMTAALDRGRGVLVYPEGTTFVGDDVRPFRLGSFTAALRTGAEVIPIGIAYADTSSSYIDEPFTTHLKRVSGNAKAVVALEVGAPISSKGKSVEQLRDTAHDAVQALVRHARGTLPVS